MNNLSLSSTRTPPFRSRPCRRRKLVIGVAIGGVAISLAARPANAFLFDMVFDPASLVEHVLQVAQLAEQITAVVQQVENQMKNLAHLNLHTVPNIAATVSGACGQLEPSLYATSSPANQLDARYPMNLGDVTWAQYQADQLTWAQNQRQSEVENRQLQNQVYGDMATATRQVRSIVEASNSASGETAAIQAHNDLLAVASGELVKLQALRIARLRLGSEQLAQQQSEASFADAERKRVRVGWVAPAPPTQSVADPFTN